MHATRSLLSPRLLTTAVPSSSATTSSSSFAGPLLFLHGMLGSGKNWSSLGKAVCAATGLRGVTVDLRNHGDSPHDVGMDYASMADDVHLVVEEEVGVGARRASLLGHSMGAKVAMATALRHPALVDRLVVVDMAPNDYPVSRNRMDAPALLDVLLEMDLGAVTRRQQADAMLRDRVPSSMLRGFLLQNLIVPPDGSPVHWRANLTAIKNNMDALCAAPVQDDVAPFTRPTLFIHGETSNYMKTVREREAARRLFPNHETHVVPNAGHWLHVDNRDDFLQAVNAFLCAHPPTDQNDRPAAPDMEQ